MAHKLALPIFDRSNYANWKSHMRGYLISFGFKTWKIVENKHVEPKFGPTTTDEISAYEENEKAKYVIFSALSKTEREKLVH